MKRKFFQSSIAIVLTLSLMIMPNSFASAQTNTNDLQKQTVGTAATATAATGPAVNYDTVKSTAQNKASALTSLYGATSVQYALIDNGSVVVSGQSGVYSKETKAAPSAYTMYGIGSISKMFTTAAVMKLVDEGKVSLDTPVVKYIPEFKMADSRYKDITVRMLLNHSSGLMGSYSLSNAMLFNDNDTITHQNFLKALKTARLKAAPGAFSVYCNDGFTLAEILVEKVTGTSFSDYISNNITAPLGLTNTKTPMDTFSRDNLAKTYVSGINAALPAEEVNAIGAGGIYSTAENLCQFARIYMNSSANILTPASVKATQNSEYKRGMWAKDSTSLLSYGLGWDSVDTYPFTDYGIKALVKGGDTSLYHGSLIVLPDQNIAMAVLSSGGSGALDQIMAQEVLLSALKAKGVIKEINPNKTFTEPAKAATAAAFEKYDGLYANYISVYKVEISDDGILSLSSALSPDSGTEKYIYTGDGKFYYADGSAYLSFANESNGKTYLYSSVYQNIPSLGQLYNAGYMAQKLEPNKISKQVKAAWNKRKDKNYFICSEKYSSQLYLMGNICSKMLMPDILDGYFINDTIKDKNNAVSNLQIPCLNGRDLNDYHFYKKGKAEYLQANAYTLISEDSMKTLSTKSSFTSQIDKNGYAHWYKIGKKSGNKKIKVALLKHSAFAVYDKDMKYVSYSVITNNNTAKLPAGGYIVFIGNANAKMKVKYVK